MRRTSILNTATAVILMLAPVIVAQQQAPRRPSTPMLTNDDISSPRSVASSEDTISRTSSSGSPLRNPRAVLESALTKMAEVDSVRTHVKTFMAGGPREILIESVKPDRVHITSSYGEMIAIGRKFYLKGTAGWEVTSAPAGVNQSDSGLDFRTLVKQMLHKSSVRVTGQALGSGTIDGVETDDYEFTVTDGSETGTIRVSVGKGDGYMRRMSLSGGAVDIRMWFTNINEPLSIEPPM